MVVVLHKQVEVLDIQVVGEHLMKEHLDKGALVELPLMEAAEAADFMAAEVAQTMVLVAVAHHT